MAFYLRDQSDFSEQDPQFAASPAATITTPQIQNWDEAHSWGNHAIAGYKTTGDFDFIQTTAPTITADGQVWLKPTDGSHPGTAGVWLSKVIATDPFVAYWVGAEKTYESSFSAATLTATTNIIAHWGNLASGVNGSFIINTPLPCLVNGASQPISIFFDVIAWDGQVAAVGTVDSENYWDLSFQFDTRRRLPVTQTLSTFRVPSKSYSSFEDFNLSTTSVVLSTLTGQPGVDYLKGYALKVGSPPSLIFNTLRYIARVIHP